MPPINRPYPWRTRLLPALLIGWLFGLSWPIFDLTTSTALSIALTTAILLLVPFATLRLFIFSFFLFCLASFYYRWTLSQRIVALPTDPITTELLVLDRPRYKGQRQYLTGQTKQGWNIEVTLPTHRSIEPGTLLTVQGPLTTILDPTNQSRSFRYLKDNIRAQLSYPNVLSQQPAQLSIWQETLITSRSFFDTVSHRLFPEPEIGLFAGIVAGFKDEIPQYLGDAFRFAGLSHIVAVSGFNVTILIQSIDRLTQSLPRALKLAILLGSIIAFVLFTGASPPVVRAGLLASLYLYVRFIHRRASILRLLILTAGLMTMQNPLIVRHDIGFQLSFAAVIGLVLYGNRIQQWLIRYRLPPWLAEVLAATIAAQVTTLPLLIHHFQTISLYSLIANTLVVPLIPLITITGPPLVLIAGIWPNLDWLALPIQWLLQYSLWVSDSIANWPAAQLATPQLSVKIWIGYYFILLIETVINKAHHAYDSPDHPENPNPSRPFWSY